MLQKSEDFTKSLPRYLEIDSDGVPGASAGGQFNLWSLVLAVVWTAASWKSWNGNRFPPWDAKHIPSVWSHRKERDTFYGTRDEEMLLLGCCLKRKKIRLEFFFLSGCKNHSDDNFCKSVFEKKSSSLIHQLLNPNALNLCAFRMHFNGKSNFLKNIWI